MSRNAMAAISGTHHVVDRARIPISEPSRRGVSPGVNRGKQTGVDGDASNNSATDSGAAYVFPSQNLPVQVTIARSDQSVTLSWPVQATNYVLEAATSLPAVSWEAVTNAATVGATERSVQTPIMGGSRFFRLRRP